MNEQNHITYPELYADAYSAYKDCQHVCRCIESALSDFDRASKDATGCSRNVLRAFPGEDEGQLLMLSKYGLTPTERAVVSCGYLVSFAAALLPIAIDHANRAMYTVAYAKAMYPEITQTIQKKYAGRQILMVLPPNESGRHTDMGTLQLACIQMTRKAINATIEANERFIEMTESVFDREGTLTYLMPGLNAVHESGGKSSAGQSFEWQIPSPRLLEDTKGRTHDFDELVSQSEGYDYAYAVIGWSNDETDFVSAYTIAMTIAGASLKDAWKKTLDTMERRDADSLVRHYSSLLNGYQTSTQRYPIPVEEAAQLVTALFIAQQDKYGGATTNRDTRVKKAIRSALEWRKDRQAVNPNVARLGFPDLGSDIYEVTSLVPNAVSRTNLGLCAYYGAFNRAPIQPDIIAIEQTLPVEFRMKQKRDWYKNRGKTALLTCEKAFDLLCKYATL